MYALWKCAPYNLSVIVSVRDCWLLVIGKNYLLLLYRFLRFVSTVAVGW